MRLNDNHPNQSKGGMLTLLFVPWLASLLVAIAFFILYLFVFRPGYQVDDDITMIQLASGYLGGTPVPFMVFSNVILGFLLNFLYRLPTNLNWEILFFLGINFLSVWSLVNIVFSLPLKSVHKFFGILVILLSDSLFLLNVTFTTMATFAALSGLVSILAANDKRSLFPRRRLIVGGLLILMSSFVRVESFFLVLLLIFPSLIIVHRWFDLKNLIVSLTITIVAVTSFYLFNSVYIKLFPRWDSFYTYTYTRSMLQDTPRVRLSNMKDSYTSVGWNFNDYKLFMSWFFPDERIYSISNIRYLIAHIPGIEKNVFNAALSYFYPKPFFDDVDSLPYFFMIAAGLIGLALYPSLRKAIWPLIVFLLTFLILIFYLIWTEKVPLRIWDSFLSTTSVFGLFILLWTESNADQSRPKIQERSRFVFVVPALLCMAGLFALYYAVVTTELNVQRQTAYQNVLSDIKTLQAQGKIQSNALIVSPAVGIPLVWSNPMFLNLPSAQYLELGWLTFSPSYYDVLHEFNVQSLPAGFYQNDNVYLMVKPGLLDNVIEYIFDHAGVVAVPQLIYSSPNYDFDPAYNNVRLYKLILQK
jgi:hypothetical protein